jgi:hypothetical protein
MKKILTLTAALSVIFTISFSPVYAEEDIKFAGEDSGVGEIRTSLLSPEDFNEIYGPDWRLMAPLDVSGEPIARYLDPKLKTDDNRYFLPDLRGRFLRMANNGVAGRFHDPEERFLGSFQRDLFQTHSHKFTFNDDGWPDDSGGRDADGGYVIDQRKNGNKKVYPVTATGGVETRPSNIAVNFYVRVACTTGGFCSAK